MILIFFLPSAVTMFQPLAWIRYLWVLVTGMLVPLWMGLVVAHPADVRTGIWVVWKLHQKLHAQSIFLEYYLESIPSTSLVMLQPHSKMHEIFTSHTVQRSDCVNIRQRFSRKDRNKYTCPTKSFLSCSNFFHWWRTLMFGRFNPAEIFVLILSMMYILQYCLNSWFMIKNQLLLVLGFKK